MGGRYVVCALYWHCTHVTLFPLSFVPMHDLACFDVMVFFGYAHAFSLFVHVVLPHLYVSYYVPCGDVSWFHYVCYFVFRAYSTMFRYLISMFLLASIDDLTWSHYDLFSMAAAVSWDAMILSCIICG